MTTFTKNIFSKITSYCGKINSSTLNGAIDIIVVRQEDGTLCCTPFHVRFGKLGVLQSAETKVYITINDVSVDDLYMQLGEAGEAAFVEEMIGTPILQPSNRLESTENNTFFDPENMITLSFENKSHTHILNGTDSTTLNNIQINHEKISISTTNSDSTVIATAATTATSTLITTDEHHVATNNSSVRRRVKRRVINRFDPHDKALSEDDDDEFFNYYSSFKRRSRIRKRESAPLSCRTNRISVSHCVTDDKQPRSIKLFRKRSASETEIPYSHVNLESTPLHGTQRCFHSIESRPKTLSLNRDDCNGQDSIHERKLSDPIGIDAFSNGNKPSEETDTLLASVLSKSMPTAHPIPNNLRNSQSDESSADFFSNGDFSPNSSYESARSLRPSSPKSDTEYELEKSTQPANNSGWQWKWGKFPEQRGVFQYFWPSKKQTPKEGIYLDEFTSNQQLDRSMYLPTTTNHSQSNMRNGTDDDQESGSGQPMSQPSFRENEQVKTWQDAQLSLCGWNSKGAPITDEQFDDQIVTYESFVKNPLTVLNPNLVARIGGKFYTWNVACAMMVAHTFYQKPLPNETMERLQEKDISSNKNRQTSASSWWFFARRNDSYPKGDTPTSDTTIRPSSNVETPKTEPIPKFDQDNDQDDNEVQKLTATMNSEKEKQQKSTTSHQSNPVRKKMILSSDELKRLNLKYGKNKVEFSVTNAWQGTTTVESNIFFFDYNTKFVISDIDGTITRSDVLGHIIPLVGGDWSHDGIAEFYNAIQENGYQFMYLSARAIGQSQLTRNLLSKVKQSDRILPSGPLLISPDTLFAALHRELVAKTPEQFKIECLKNIASLFPGKNPFYAGFGNRINDQWAYTAVGIPLSRIYTINPRGEVVRQKLAQSLSSSYRNLHEMVDLLFPPMDSFSASETYSVYTYWREEPNCSSFDEEMRADLQAIANRQKPNKATLKAKSSTAPMITTPTTIKSSNEKLLVLAPSTEILSRRA